MLQRRDVRESKFHQRWDLQRARLGDVAQRAAPRIAILFGVGQGSNPHAVQHHPDHTINFAHESLSHRPAAGTLARSCRTARGCAGSWGPPPFPKICELVPNPSSLAPPASAYYYLLPLYLGTKNR